MKAIILLGLITFMLSSCKKGSIDDMYPNQDAEIINQDSIDAEMMEVSPDSLNDTSTIDTVDVNLDSLTLQNNRTP